MNNVQGCFTDDEFETFIANELEKSPLRHQYAAVFELAPKIITEWRRRYRGNPSLWKRIFDKDRVIKAFIEAVPVIDAVKRLVENTDLDDGKQFRILDLACGRGYLSMMLSHLLPKDKVKKIVLVDKQWPMHNVTPQPHHISWTHIYGSYKECEDQSIPCYFETWPIELHTSKSVSYGTCCCVFCLSLIFNCLPIRTIYNKDLKSSQQIRSLESFHINNKGPIILVAIHLCGTLSLKAVELFNNNPEIQVRSVSMKPLH